MKATSLFILFLLIAINLPAQNPVFTKSEIKHARVFYNGAELQQKVEIQLPKGQSEIVFTNIADQLTESSIQIGSDVPLTIMSVQFSNSYIEEYDNPDRSPLTKPLRDSIELLEVQLSKINNTINTDEQTVRLLDANLNAGDKSVQFTTVAEMNRWVEYYQTKRLALQDGLIAKRKDKEETQRKLRDLKSRLQLGKDTGTKVSQGKLIVRVMTDKAQKANFDIRYATSLAGWSPSYDLTIDNIDDPIKMTYKAQIAQNSGLDWNNVQLSLTSGKINQNQQIPQLYQWFIRYSQPNYMQMNTGYNAGAQKSRELYDAAPAPESSDLAETMEEYTEINENQINMSFDIQIPYTLLSNGKMHNVSLNDFYLQGDYDYYAAPKQDLNAYLVARISDYAEHHLLSGYANIIFNGMFVGKTYLSTENTEEKLQLNLGRDPQINIQRTMMKDKSGTKFLSSKKEQSFVYEITVKNNKKQKAEIRIQDQIPLSTDKSIEIELTDKSGADVDEEKGILTWQLNLKPGETKKLRLGYRIKSDKDKKLGNI